MKSNELAVKDVDRENSSNAEDNSNTCSNAELQITKNNRRAYELLLRIQSQHESNRVISVSTKKIIST